MKTSDNIDLICKSLSIAQSCIKPASKDSINPHYRSKYSDLSSIWESIREPLTSNGLCVLQDVTTNEGRVSICTRISHSSGQWIEFGPLTLCPAKQDAHAIGSCITYGKRYSLCAAIGVVSGDEDDDGNAAVAPAKEKQKIEKDRYSPQEETAYLSTLLLDWNTTQALLNAFIDDCAAHYKKDKHQTIYILSFEHTAGNSFQNWLSLRKSEKV